MKKTIIITIFLQISLLAFSQEINRQVLENALDSLDLVIENKSYYDNIRKKNADEIKSKIKKMESKGEEGDSLLELYWELYNSYNRVQADSAFLCLDKLETLKPVISDRNEHFRVLISRAETFGVSGMYMSAFEELNKIDSKSLSPDIKNQYYHIRRTINGWLSDYSMDPVITREYSAMTQEYRDSIIATQEEGIGKNIVRADKLLVEGEADRSLALSLSDLSLADKDMKRYIYSNIAEAYKQVGNRVSEEYYLCLAAIEDIKSGVKEYMALPKLARLLYDDGDIERAYRYLICSMEDASMCHARLRAIESSSIFPIIDKSYKEREEKLHVRERMLTIFLAGLVAVLIFMLFYLRRKKSQLSEARQELLVANESLKASNRSLSELDKVKEEYIAHFLSQCRSYLEVFQKYRLSLLKLAKSKSHDELLKRLSSSELMDQEEFRFYRDFDEAFLNIHPHFVERFNGLLKEGCEIKMKRNELLTTELRIFALIRLGVTDTGEIAHFLNYSTTTVYNYRSRVRNNSKYRKDDFEEIVRYL